MTNKGHMGNNKWRANHKSMNKDNTKESHKDNTLAIDSSNGAFHTD